MTLKAKVKTKRPDKFQRWMIASFFLIPLLLFGSIGAYYAYFPVKMHILTYLLRFNQTNGWARQSIYSQGEKAVPYLIRALWNRNSWVQGRAEGILEDLTERGAVLRDEKRTAWLIRLLSHPKSRVRGGAVRALGIFHERSALPQLMKLLSDRSRYVRCEVAQAFGNIGDREAVPGLIKLLSDPHYLVRCAAARALGELARGGPGFHFGRGRPAPFRAGAYENVLKAVPHLVKLLSDTSSDVRCVATKALGRIGDSRAVPELIKLLSDPVYGVRVNAADALGEIGSAEAVGPLIGCLKERPMPRVLPEDWRSFQAHDVVEALEKITGQSFGDIAYAGTGAKLEQIIQKWLQWWEENKERYQEERALPPEE